MNTRLYLRPRAMAVAALGALAWAVIGVTFASLTTHPVVHHIFQSTHIEHFAAFYVLALLAVAGLPVFRTHWILVTVVVFAVTLELIRMSIPLHQERALADLFCDLAGVAAVLAPMMVDKLRLAFRLGERRRHVRAPSGPWAPTGNP